MVRGDHDLRTSPDKPGDAAVSGIFHFRCLTPCFPRHDAVLMLFAGPTAYDRNAVTDAITEETRRALAPEAAYLLYPESVAAQAADDLAKHSEIFGPLDEDAAIGIYGYDQTGTMKLHRALRGAPASNLPRDHTEKARNPPSSLRRHSGALDAGPTAHFVRPSTRPSSRFLRASHALSDGAEIYFAALWLLPYFADDIEYVHLDTSGIAGRRLCRTDLRSSRPRSSPPS